MQALSPGTLLHQASLEIVEVLGQGGLSILYRAKNSTGQQVALKECFPTGCRREGDLVLPASPAGATLLQDQRDALLHRAGLLKEISHPGLVSVLDCFAANHSAYLVMELLPGPSLQQYLEESGPPPSGEALHWTGQLCQAVTHLHQAGLLHLDIKPENILLCPQDGAQPARAVLLDYDLVRPHNVEAATTRPLALATRCGTPGYAPLEQYAQHIPLTFATDVYALGATLYHLLTGSPPCPAVDRAMGTHLTAPRELKPELEEHLAQAALRALAMAPEQRPSTPEALWELCLGRQQPNPPQDATAGNATPANPPDPVAAPAPPPPRGHLPLAGPQVVPHTAQPPAGIYRIVLRTQTPVFPNLCACCGAPAGASHFVKSPGYSYQVPLCDFCEHHRESANTAGAVTFWGLAVSVVIALAGLGISVATSSIWPILLGPLGIILNFSAMSYGALKNSRTEELLHDSCTDVSEPVTHNFNGKVHIWRFKNADAAREFRRANAAHVV